MTKKISLSHETIAALSLIDLLVKLNWNIEQQLEFYAKLKLEKSELTGYREHKKLLSSYAEAILDLSLANHSKEGAELHNAFQYRQELLLRLASKILEEDRNQKITVPPHLILDSIIHMHCNRFLGRDNKKERKARLFAYHTLSTINEKAKRASSQKVMAAQEFLR